jgi:hypothetical protein
MRNVLMFTSPGQVNQKEWRQVSLSSGMEFKAIKSLVLGRILGK